MIFRNFRDLSLFKTPTAVADAKGNEHEGMHGEVLVSSVECLLYDFLVGEPVQTAAALAEQKTVAFGWGCNIELLQALCRSYFCYYSAVGEQVERVVD